MKQTTVAAALLACGVALSGCAAPEQSASSTQETSPTSSMTAASAQPVDYTQARVSYLGPEGTYTQEACIIFFGGQGTYVPQVDVPASVAMLEEGESDYAVIPQENAIGGAIVEYLDEVVSHKDFSIVGEVELPINQNLLVKPGVALDQVSVVYSHKQGIAQGSDWLKENIPQAEVVEVESTAEGAKRAAADESGSAAAIGSAAAAEVYELEVAAEAIQRNAANKTRFYVLAKASPVEELHDRMAFCASGDVTDLAELLESIEAHDLEVIAVHDRPEKTELGRYTYLIECAGGGKDAFDAVSSENPTFDLRYLGSFPLVVP